MIKINKKIKFTNEVKSENFTVVVVVGKYLTVLNAVQIQYVQRTLHIFTELAIFLTFDRFF